MIADHLVKVRFLLGAQDGGVPGVVNRPAFEKLGFGNGHGGSNPSSSA